MIFTSYWFCAFVAILLPLYWLCRQRWLRLGLLLTGSLVFYAHFAGAAGMIAIILLALTTYCAGLYPRKHLLHAAMALPVLALLFYKYSHFLAAELLAPFFPSQAQWVDGVLGTWTQAGPPLAVSFFTFEFVHYLYDLSKGSAPIRNPVKFCLFAFYFPSLVAGPIKRYQSFLPALETSLERVSLEDVKVGILRMATGYLKKVVVADNLTAAIQFYQPQFAALSLLERWLLVVALAFRILLDFSGYSDIAIGCARTMGLRLPENFNWPYLATSAKDFWHRWHMSLSSWIRDYVYIPLGGNRRGALLTALNGLIAFALCGLWHGAAWNFVFWGLYHGLGLVLCSSYKSLLGPLGARLETGFARAPIAAWLLTQLFVVIGWIYFFYPIAEANRMFLLLFKGHP